MADRIEPRYLTADQVCEYLSISREDLDRLVRDRRIPAPIELAPGLQRWDRFAVDASMNGQLVRASASSRDRIRSDAAAQQTGLSVRQVQAMAARGQIPGAAKLGSVWTFDPRVIAMWISRQEEVVQRPAATNRIYGKRAAGVLPAATIEARYERLLGLKRPRR